MFNSWNLEAAVAESYKEVIKKFEETLGQTAINFRVARLQLHFMHQDRGETLDSFVTRCRTQALKCEFEAAELEARIIEQIIARTPIQKFQSELLGKDNNLTLEQAVELGRKHEAALFSAERLREMATGNTAISTDTINQKRGPQKQSQCKNCGGDHARRREACPAHKSKCHGCGRIGHWKDYCLSTKAQQRRQGRQNRDGSNKRNRGRSQSRPRRGSHNKSVNMVNEHDDEPECRQDQWQDIVYDTINIHSCTTEHNRTKAFATLRIFPNNNSEVRQYLKAKVDSGAEGNTLPLRTFKSMFPNNTDTQGHPVMKETMGIRLTTYNGSALKCHGQVEIKCEYQGSTCMANFYVVDTPGPPLIGLPTCEKLRVIELNCSINKQDSHSNRHKPVNSKQELLQEYPNSFDRIGDFGEQLTTELILKPDAEPYIDPPRKYPLHKTDKIKQELDRMEELGVIRKVTEHTEWCSSLVFASKPDGSLRVCLDPARLNKGLI